MSATFLDNVVVVELGDREAVGLCGSLFSELGATVFLVEGPASASGALKWSDRPRTAAGKRPLRLQPGKAADEALLGELLAVADVVLSSPDAGTDWRAALVSVGARTIHCEITAFGMSGPLGGKPYSDAMVQAYSGAASVTGPGEGAPLLSRCAYLDSSTAALAASASLAALRVARRDGVGQRVAVSMLDAAVSMSGTFLSQYVCGIEPVRIGNRHVSMSPWNAYRTQDGWVLLCTGSDDQWKRLCPILGRSDLLESGELDSPSKRVADWKRVDGIVEEWTRGRTTEACMAAFNDKQLPCGPVYGFQELFEDASLRMRNLVQSAVDPASGATLRIAGSPFRASLTQGRPRTRIEGPDAGRPEAIAIVRSRAGEGRPRKANGQGKVLRAPLAGLKVVEVGSYTTAPSCTRQLAALGAEVIKVEPPVGDPARSLPPLRHGQGAFFTMSNSDKAAVSLDFAVPADLDAFKRLLRQADVFVENLRPRALAKFGLAPDDLARLNPRLVYCSISGFGSASPYADRGAMDTTIQAMSGLMALTAGPDGTPVKIGLSAADASGGQYGLVAVLAGLEARERLGQGQWIDLSMQDISAHITEAHWNAPPPQRTTLLACEGGWVVCDVPEARLRELVAPWACGAPTEAPAVRLTAEALQAELAPAGVTCIPLHTIAQAMRSAQVLHNGNLMTGLDNRSHEWTLLACPMMLERTPAAVRQAIGPLGSDTQRILAEWLQVSDDEEVPAA